MTRRLFALLLVVAATPCAYASEQVIAGHPVGQLAWMVGGTWTAATTLPSGDPVTIEARFQWASHNKAIRYSVVRKSGSRVLPTLEGICGWHPGRKQLALWEMDAEGNLTESTFRVEGSKLTYDEMVYGVDGSALPVRAEAIREGDDQFVFAAFVEKDGRWPVVFQATYKRVRE